MSQRTDFNDLRAASSREVVRMQLVDKPDDAQPDSPAPSEEGRPLIKAVLARYALAMPDAKVWDSLDKKLLKQSAARAALGKKLFDEWLNHEERRTVKQSDVAADQAAAQAEGRGRYADAIRRYVYLYPTDSAWDADLGQVVPLSGLRYALADSFEQWLKSGLRREINHDNLVFDPTQRVNTTNHINMFRGLLLIPDDNPDKCRAIRNLVWLLCNEDNESFEWLTRWLAFPLQNLGAKMATAVLMHSETQGSGKSLLFDEVIRRIYGEYGATLGQHQLESAYTDWRSKKLFCLFEEIFSRDQKYSHVGTLKHMVTGRTHRIEKKFVSGWEEANHLNAVFLSNEIQPFPVEPSDRRVMVIWPDRPLSQSIQDAVMAELGNGGVEAFYGWLLKLSLSGFHEHTKPPMTAAKERLIDFGRSGWDTFYREWERGSLGVPYMSCLGGDLFLAYERWCQSRREHVLSYTKFAGFISTRLRRRQDVHYDTGLGRKKGTFFVVGQCPGEGSQASWLGKCAAEFRAALDKTADID